jgi:hypothetical protein
VPLTDIKDIGITKNEVCAGDMGTATCDPKNNKGGTLDKLMVSQVIFTNTNGISCDLVNKFDLRKKTTTLKVNVNYTYESDSHVSVEFIKQSEWDRLVQNNKLNLRDVQAEYSSAPVKFPIGTAGLKQPILASVQEFNIGLRLDAEALNSQIESAESVSLNVPTDFKLKSCTPEKSGMINLVDGSGRTIGQKITWEKDKLLGRGTKILFCMFEKLGDDKIGSAPTKTYEITAHAKYRVSNWRNVDLALEFGGVCCRGEGGGEYDCLTGFYCVDCTCVPRGNGVDADKPKEGWFYGCKRETPPASNTGTTPSPGGTGSTPSPGGTGSTPAPGGTGTTPSSN